MNCVLVGIETVLAEVTLFACYAMINLPDDVPQPATLALGPLVDRKLLIPSFEVSCHNAHRIQEMIPAQRASNPIVTLELVLDPYFKAFGVEVILAL